MAHALIRASSQTLLNVILALKSTLSTTNRRQEIVKEMRFLYLNFVLLVSFTRMAGNIENIF
jgi:hypothetical protein